MKNIIAILLLVVSTVVSAQEKKDSAHLLKEPASWIFERFSLPPVFAPNFAYAGWEELRFSPGMFDKNSPQYFTYAFVAQIDNRGSISKNEINNYLFDYFKGLCGKTATDRHLVVDTSKITVAIEKKKDTGKETVYNALLHVFGVFADGAPVQLNMEIKVLPGISANKVWLVFIASPHEKTDAIWQQLYAIQKNFAIPVK